MDDTEFRKQHRRALAEDRVSGASQLARQALDSLAEFAGSYPASDVAELRRELLAFAEELQFARPNMAPVYNLAERFAEQVDDIDTSDVLAFRQQSAAAAQNLSDLSVDAVAGAATAAAPLVPNGSVVITHTLSSTIRQLFEQLGGVETEVIVSESRPGMEGREQARYLAHLGLSVTFITDAQMGVFAGRATVALVGADAVLADGSLVNKAGTFLLALAARHHGIPFYTCCESFKHSPFSPEGYALEETAASEVEPPRHRCIQGRNVMFDLTPADLISGWVTEEGIQSSSSI